MTVEVAVGVEDVAVALLLIGATVVEAAAEEKEEEREGALPAHEEPEEPSLTAVKLAQAMRVLLAKCRTKLRFPRKAASPAPRETNSSV